MNKTDIIKNILEFPDFLEKDKYISNISNFKTRAKTRYYFEINNEKDIDKLYEINKFITKNSLKFLIIS